MNTDPHDLRKTVQTFSDEMTLALLASLDTVSDAERLPANLRAPAVDAFIDASLGVAQARLRATGPFAASGHNWMAPYKAMLSDEGIVRQMLNLPPAPKADVVGSLEPDTTETFASQLAESHRVMQQLAAQVAVISAATKPRSGMSFSEAADAYVEKLRSAHGDDHPNLGYFINIS